MSDWLEDLADGVVDFIESLLPERKGRRMGRHRSDRVRLRCTRCNQQVPQLVALNEHEPARLCRACANPHQTRSTQ